MKIIVISDTHSAVLPKVLQQAISGAELVIHAGDLCDMGVLESLKGAKDVKAVYGNMDGPELRKVLPRSMVISCDSARIGVFHGEGDPAHLLERVKGLFKDQALSAVVFGHSHEPMNAVIDGVLYFNPGSPTDSVRSPYLSYGILEVKGGQVKGRIVKIK
jgi:putative phosphoesterase